jgi:hypothetical protein
MSGFQAPRALEGSWGTWWRSVSGRESPIGSGRAPAVCCEALDPVGEQFPPNTVKCHFS